MKMVKKLMAGAAGLAMLAACETYGTEPVAEADAAPVDAEKAMEAADDAMDKADAAMDEAEDAMEMADEAMVDTNAAMLSAVLAAQPDEAKARYEARNPAETLTFFGIEPGMKVAEALPGGGWYTKILIPYLGPDGVLVGAHYPDEMWGKFGFGDEWTQARVEDTANWPETAAEWNIENGAKVKSVKLTEMPEKADGQLDAVLFIRALHNLNRFEDDGSYMSDTVAEAYRVLKPGGIVGVVQHSVPDTHPDESSDGSKGYLRQADVVAAFESAGFTLEATSDVNANAKDMPTAEDMVWRLPPTTAGTEEDTPEREAMEAIGESNRMTLRFRKPA